MKNYLVIISGIILLIISNYWGHIYPPFSISFTPVLLGSFTALVLFFTDFRSAIKISLIAAMIISNDVLIKFFAGGANDFEGLGWITLFLFFGLAISLLIITVYGFSVYKNGKIEYFLVLLCSCAVIAVYLSYYNTLGMAWNIPPSKDIELSKTNGLFIAEIQIAENPVRLSDDSIFFKQAWCEKQIREDDRGFLKKQIRTNKNNCFIYLNAISNQAVDSNILYYTIDNPDMHSGMFGGRFGENEISFTVDTTVPEVTLYLFKGKTEKLVKEIKVKLKT